MIDEELYQQAADELNSDRRRPHIWARACALASDDHDEARYLYTNLRVEELIAEREKATTGSSPGADSVDIAYSELSLVEEGNRDNGDDTGFMMEINEESRDAADVEARVDEAQLKDSALLADPDEHLMADYVPEEFEPLDDTYTAQSADDNDTINVDVLPDDTVSTNTPADDTVSVNDLVDDTIRIDPLADDTYAADNPADQSHPDDALAEEDFAQELAIFKAEEGEPVELNPAELNTDDLSSDENSDSQSIPTLHNKADDAQATNSNNADVFEISTDSEIRDLTAAHPNDLTQANVDVLDAHADDLDELLGETGYQTPLAEETDTNVLWLEDGSTIDKNTAKPAESGEPFIYEDDPYTDELSRQADELDLGSTPTRPADYNQQLSDELREDKDFPEPATSTAATMKDTVEIPESADSSVSAAVASGAVSGSSPVAHADHAAELTEPTTAASVWPMDLTEGNKGKLFSIYQRNNDAQAVRNGVSWSALFFTLPYLIYRHLFGTALAYSLLWVIVVGGLIISGLAWLDAGASVTPLTQACAIGFALLTFIGLIYLPFRYGNIWRSERLENRGYELVAVAKAKNPGRAIARAHRHAALND